MSEALIQLHDAVFGYGHGAVVKVNHMQISGGRCLGIFGPNGSGKTTLIRGITRLLPPMRGRVEHLPLSGSRTLRIGYLPQHRDIELHWPMTALDAASTAISARRWFGWIGARRQDVTAMMRQLGIADLAARPFAALSGGQQQRVLLAGALAGDPTVLVLDEPTEGLDVQSTRELVALLRRFIAQGLAMIIISHEADDLVQVADEIAWLRPAVQQGQPSEVEIVAPRALGEAIVQAARSAT